VAIAWGTLLALLGLLAWVGQVISWVAPQTAVRLGLMESPDDVEPAYAADTRGEAAWDALALWTLPVAGVLLALDLDAWAYFGLVGGGMYLYFAGRGISTRRMLRSCGYRVGDETSVRIAYVTLSIWGIAAALTIGAAVVALSTS
jgi:hypothetical protein